MNRYERTFSRVPREEADTYVNQEARKMLGIDDDEPLVTSWCPDAIVSTRYADRESGIAGDVLELRGSDDRPDGGKMLIYTVAAHKIHSIESDPTIALFSAIVRDGASDLSIAGIGPRTDRFANAFFNAHRMQQQFTVLASNPQREFRHALVQLPMPIPDVLSMTRDQIETALRCKWEDTTVVGVSSGEQLKGQDAVLEYFTKGPGPVDTWLKNRFKEGNERRSSFDQSEDF